MQEETKQAWRRAAGQLLVANTTNVFYRRKQRHQESHESREERAKQLKAQNKQVRIFKDGLPAMYEQNKIYYIWDHNNNVCVAPAEPRTNTDSIHFNLVAMPALV